jgi:hypothetical protein
MSEQYYLGNPLLKKANTKIEFTEEQVVEWIKCSKDPAYFAKNYIKIVTLDLGLSEFDMYPFQEKMIKTFHNNRFTICKLPRQSGKALSLDTPIPTPNGWTTMGEISVGDNILSPDGNSVSVTMKTETMHNHNCYKIHFDTGEEIVADAEHLWEVNSSYWSAGKKIVTTEDIFDVYEKKSLNKRGKGVVGSYFIEYTKPIKKFFEKDLPIDPYLLGVWLGDGYSSDSRVIAHKNDFEFYKNKINIEYLREDNNCIRFKCADLYQKLKENNLLKNKHIPQVYLRSSYESKLELLRGLMDTDGSLKPNTRSFEFYQKNYELIAQVVELLSSMGIKSRVRVKEIKGCLYHTVSFTTTERVFNLPRKYNLINNNRPLRPQDKRIYIQKIEKVDSVPVACISVDSDDHLFLCGKTFIPTHNSTIVVSYLLHYAIFNDNTNIAILANKASTARDLLDRLQTGYENLPKWLQQGVVSWNKGSMELENKSKITAASTSASSIRGGTYNIIFLDEFAFVPNTVADNFFSSVYPVITSGKSSKVIVVSTPYGMNHFYRLWDDAQSGKNEYVPIEVHWTDVPGRDEEFKRSTIANTSESQWRQEFECLFLGSSDTLISGPVLNRLTFHTPKISNASLDVYEDPQEDHTYVITVDVARGVEKDYSAFIVIDVSQFPHKVVAKYRNNQIRPILFPQIIKEVAVSYNRAYILCEVNDVGDQVAAGLHYDLEYPNLLMSSMRGRAGQILGQGFSGKKVQLGVKMSKTTKKVGCLNLKTLIEDNKVIFNDFEIINELTTFIQKGNSFEAEDGRNDDLVMCLVMYSWLILQDYFKELTDQDIRKKIYEEQKNQVEQDMSPFGFVDDGVNQESTFVDSEGNRWFADEYGDRSYMWDYL